MSKAESIPKAKPAYSVKPANKGYLLTRDGAVFVTPAGHNFIVPTQALADTIAEEWQGQDAKINPTQMPMTQFAVTALDIASLERDAMISRVVAYAESELLCHRSGQPPELFERQQNLWQPLLNWIAARFGARLRVGTELMPIAQETTALVLLRNTVAACDDFHLTGLQQAVTISGSLVLGLALAEQHLDPNAVFFAAELEQLFQMEKWGDDPATTNRHETIKQELNCCGRWFKLIKADG